MAEAEFFYETLSFLDVPLNTGGLGASNDTDVMMDTEEGVDLGNYATCTVRTGVGL